MILKTSERMIKVIKVEADRVLNIADATIEYLKSEAEKSTHYDDIQDCVSKIEALNAAVKHFKGDIPDESWREHIVLEHMPYFIRSADRVLDLCK